jgi:hypothetical protein
VSEHRYELRRGTTPDESIEMGIWCALGTCAGHRELVMHPAGKTFTGAELFEHMAGHVARFSGPAEALAAVSRSQRLTPPSWPSGVVMLPPDADVKPRRDRSGWLVLLGGALAVAGGILARLLGWSA